MIAKSKSVLQIRHVQSARLFAPPLICRNSLETREQPPQGRLNTRLTCNACAVAPRGSYPYRLNRWYGDFHRLLSRRTACTTYASRNMAGTPAGVSGASSARRQQYPRCGVIEGKRSDPEALGIGGFLSVRFSFKLSRRSALGLSLQRGWGFLLPSLSFNSFRSRAFLNPLPVKSGGSKISPDQSL